jgi:hypothetical protein
MNINRKKSVCVFLLCILIFSIMIFKYDVLIYYKFYDSKVVGFYLFWKILGFLIIYEKLYNKKWLTSKLNF